jgi:hypothetical protein
VTPIPEPAADLRAQLAAVLDPSHPKVAMLVVPGNEIPEIPPDLCVVTRPEGTLITRELWEALNFLYGYTSDSDMALMLGYPENKDDVVRSCGGDLSLARAVQARDAGGNVVTEAFASPDGLQRTISVLSHHVPHGGALVALTPVEAICRRVALRCKEV